MLEGAGAQKAELKANTLMTTVNNNNNSARTNTNLGQKGDPLLFAATLDEEGKVSFFPYSSGGN